MALTTTTSKLPSGQTLEENFDASIANTALTVTTPTGKAKRLLAVYVHYSAAPTHSGVTVTFTAGQGAAYNTLLFTSPANASDVAYSRADEEVVINADDAITVVAPAGGVGITAQITILLETS